MKWYDKLLKKLGLMRQGRHEELVLLAESDVKSKCKREVQDLDRSLRQSELQSESYRLVAEALRRDLDAAEAEAEKLEDTAYVVTLLPNSYQTIFLNAKLQELRDNDPTRRTR